MRTGRGETTRVQAAVSRTGTLRRDLTSNTIYKCLISLARPEGFEPPTPRFVVWCSIQLSYGRLLRIAREMLPDQPRPAGTGLSL